MELYQQLEQSWAEWNGLDPRGMVACASGTAALHLALEAFQLPLGSTVIVPDLTMIAVPRAVTLAGLTPVFVDCDNRLNIVFNLLPMRSPYPSAIVAVHTYGVRCLMEWFGGMEETPDTEQGTYIIEDLAEAHGVRPYALTDAACWSYYKNKIVAGEEGGAVWFRDPQRAELARQLRSLGFTAKHDFTHIPRGHNYRLSNAHAALILDSLRRVDRSLENRWRQWQALDNRCPKEWRVPRPDAPWVYALRIKGMASYQQDAVVAELNKVGIAARHCFKPATLQTEYRDYQRVRGGDRWEAFWAAQEVIYLPLSSYQSWMPQLVNAAFEVIEGGMKKAPLKGGASY